MKLNKDKLLITMARACMNPYDLCSYAGIPYQTYLRALKNTCKPATAGKIANALGVDVTELLED